MQLEAMLELGAKGTSSLINLAKEQLGKAIKDKGKDCVLAFPETNYFLPLVFAWLKLEVRTLGDCLLVLQELDKLNQNQATSSGLKLDSLGGILNKGLAAALALELLAALNYLYKVHPHSDCAGFLSDTLLRSLGIQLVDGRIAGIAVILGPAKDAESAERLVRDFQAKGIVSLLAGEKDGQSFKKQLQERNVSLGLQDYIVPLGQDYLSAVYAMNWAVRASLIFGGLKSGQWQEILRYTRERVPAMVVLLSYVDEILVAAGLGALAMGFPIVTDLDVPPLGKIDTTLFEALVVEKDYQKIASASIACRGVKVKVTSLNLPVPYAAAFEGERVRKEQLWVQFGGKASQAFEWLLAKPFSEVEDGKIELIGPDIDNLPEGEKSLPLGIVVEVAGRRMEKDYEPIIERQIHRYINYAMGLMHLGQRDMNLIRISKDAYAKGFRLKHIGIILHGMIHQEYSAIVDKVQVKLYTNLSDVVRVLAEAKVSYNQRDERLSGLTDESVDTFYSCLLCQSFAPNHVCIITPERLGLCGAYSWLDGKASYEITPTGPNQPVKKGKAIDERLGQWQGVNDFVYLKSNKSVDKVCMYSLMNSPQTSCGCFECILAIIPEVNGVMAVHRDYIGMTPCGMNFTTLAGSVGGGVQSPGFLGVGKLYLTSKKFIAAEGGLRRLVWMPKELKEFLGDKLKKRFEEEGLGEDFMDKIADELVATTTDELLEYLKKVKHPALEMEPLL